MKQRILVVDDEENIRGLLKTILEKKGYESRTAIDLDSGMAALKQEAFDLILLDLVIPGSGGRERSREQGMELLRHCRQNYPDINVILLTGHSTPQTNVEAAKLGAYDYITKPFRIDDLMLVVTDALREKALVNDNIAFHNILQKTLSENFIYESPKMQFVAQMIEKVAPTDAGPILILGDTGVGKEVVAKTIHNLSTRKNNPFLEINCTSLQEKLLENELFGHEKGAFTDAKDLKKGLFEIASEGTLFLDEIGDIDTAIQAKLLKVLESNSFFRVGGLHPIRTSTRIIAATNKNLEQAVKDRVFREDLYYRLKMFTITVPPLRERREDIMALARFFMKEFNNKFKKGFKAIAPNAERILRDYNWYGNVRELRNAIERIILLEDDETIKVRHLPLEMFDQVAAATDDAQSAVPGDPAGDQLEVLLKRDDGSVTLKELEHRYILKVLDKTKNNKTKAARILGINRKTLWDKLKENGKAEE